MWYFFCFFRPLPGLGKTTLAQIVARNSGSASRHFRPVIARAGDLAALLTNLEEAKCVHRRDPRLNPWSRSAVPGMEDRALDLISARGPSGALGADRPDGLTLIGATTRAGLLTTPLRDRSAFRWG